ncbi:MAG TPA: hypothetical protein VFY72_03860 [Beijerinckiaceae bacterium]|nr:hypothetical protein [Beijerinckiaceae bacterium]
MARLVALLALLVSLLPAAALRAASLDGIAVEVTNASEPVLCAEKDNVTIKFTSPEVRRFRLQATHPAYLAGIVQDRHAPDFTACEDLSPANTEARPPRQVTFYEDVETWLTGTTFANFWRPHDVPFRVGDRVERGLHVVQLWVRRDERAEEVLVIYPADGYWRIRPLPPAHMRWSAYGSSFLVGPVETEGRPVVNIKEISFDPKAMTFRISFARGGSATLKLETLDRDRLVLDVQFDQPVAGRPFAALRSMYVTEFNADVARIALREPDARGWREEMIMSFAKGRATDVWTGRLVPSRHNTSAPDMIFNRFQSTPAASR